MPYLHYETDTCRQEMSEAIKKAKDVTNSGPESDYAPIPNNKYDEQLITTYLRPSSHTRTPPLQIRRTLDQFFYTTLDDTDSRDQDQVVYRHTKRRSMTPVILMVDQLWLWVINEGWMSSDWIWLSI